MRETETTADGSTVFVLSDAELRLAIPAGWKSDRTRTSISLTAGDPGTVPIPMIAVAILPGDPREVLSHQVEAASIALTDFTVLHFESRNTPGGNWDGCEIDSRFVLGTYRQGVWTVALEFGIVGSDGEHSALLTTACDFLTFAAIESTVERVVGSCEVRW